MMLWELKRLVRMPVFYAAVAFSSALWLYICWVGLSHGVDLSAKASLFWHKTGAIFAGFTVLFGCMQLFTLDYEKGLTDVILSAKNGRRHAAVSRFKASLVFCVIFILAGTLTAILPSLIFKFPVRWGAVIFRTMIALIGMIMYCIFCCGVADISKSRAMTLTVCGLSYAFPFLIYEVPISNVFFWFLKHGLFSDIMRAYRITTQPVYGLMILSIWYAFFLIMELSIVICKRKQRGEW